MSRNRNEWPEPWVRLRWSANDLRRIDRLLVSRALPDGPQREFVADMQRLDLVTLQQVSFLRNLARKYGADVGPPTAPLTDRDGLRAIPDLPE